MNEKIRLDIQLVKYHKISKSYYITLYEKLVKTIYI